jgi:TIR domain
MDALGVAGFWSYARQDDEAEGSRITQLATLIGEEYALVTAQELRLFLDREDIAWGDQWRRRIDQALAGVTFFIPVVTPRYFQREECRRELLDFAGRAADLGVSELLLPILYADVPGLEEDAADEAMATVARIQYEDWRDLRFEDPRSPAHRTGVHRLVVRLVEIGETIAERPVQSPEERRAARLIAAGEAIGRQSGDSPVEEAEPPGVIEILAEMEAAMPRWHKTIEQMGSVLERVGEEATKATAQVARSDAAGKGFAGRLTAAHALKSALAEPADEFLALATSYASDLLSVDSGFVTMIDLAEAGPADEAERQAYCELFEAVRGLAGAARENVAGMRELQQGLETVGTWSRELRPVLRKLREGLQRVLDGQAFMDSWVERIDASSVKCPEAESE